MKPKLTERGWPGHFICAERCTFRRNTLIDFGRMKIIVSTVGMMRDGLHGQGAGYDTIGAGGRYYETMAFKAKKSGPYWDIDAAKEVPFKSEGAICSETGYKKLPADADNKANEMHDRVVAELSRTRGCA